MAKSTDIRDVLPTLAHSVNREVQDRIAELVHTINQLNASNEELLLKKNDLEEANSSLRQELEATRDRVHDIQDTAEECERLNEILSGRKADHSIRCTEGKTFWVKPNVTFDVVSEFEIEVSDCKTLADAQKYCKQLNIQDRLSDGRINLHGQEAQEVTEFIETHKDMLTELLKVPDDVESYLDTLED